MEKLRNFINKRPESPVLLIGGIALLIVTRHAKNIILKIEVALFALFLISRFIKMFFEDLGLKKPAEMAENVTKVLAVANLIVASILLLINVLG